MCVYRCARADEEGRCAEKRKGACQPGHEMERLLMRFLGGGRLPHPFFKFLLGGNSRQHRDEQHIYIGRDVDGRVVCVKRSGARTDGRPPWESLETLRRGEPRPSTHTQ